MKMWRRKKRMFEPVVLKKEQLLAAFRVPEDHPLLQGILHVLKAQEAAAADQILPGQPELARRDVTTEMHVVRELRETLMDLVEKANSNAKGVKDDDQ